MKQRTLKEVAQAGLVLGYKWIAKDVNGLIYLYSKKPKMGMPCTWHSSGDLSRVIPKIMYYHNEPENSLLKLSDIVEGA